MFGDYQTIAAVIALASKKLALGNGSEGVRFLYADGKLDSSKHMHM